jgi:NAD(P)-dependent dehydrogenase (short-subunit alcohol dehydrogenase family)
MKTVLITGCSSGFGLETAHYFLKRDWKVIATMRSPSQSSLSPAPNLKVMALDVTDPESIRRAVEEAGPIDAVVNNAGVGLLSVLEGTPTAAVRALFEANTFGAIAVTQAFLPQLRRQRAGAIVNVSSSVTLKALPMLSAYTASKAALNAFTESLAFELEPFNVRVRLVLPGQALATPFGKNAMALMQSQGVTVPDPYSDFASGVFEKISGGGLSALSTTPLDVAKAVWAAVNDPGAPLLQPAGADAIELANSR